MIAVIVPVHNEERLLATCLSSIEHASAHPRLRNRPVKIWAILNACTDRSRQIATRFPVEIVETPLAGVGHARALGASRALHDGATWLAFTDADSEVPADWLYRQEKLDCDVVCGCVEVDDWAHLGEVVRRKYQMRYDHEDGHRHIHGANLGVSADAYRASGGFSPLTTGEDVALVSALIDLKMSIAWTGRARVRTSGRLRSRAPEGFAHYLRRLAEATRTSLPGAGSAMYAAPR